MLVTEQVTFADVCGRPQHYNLPLGLIVASTRSEYRLGSLMLSLIAAGIWLSLAAKQLSTNVVVECRLSPPKDSLVCVVNDRLIFAHRGIV